MRQRLLRYASHELEMYVGELRTAVLDHVINNNLFHNFAQFFSRKLRCVTEGGHSGFIS